MSSPQGKICLFLTLDWRSSRFPLEPSGPPTRKTVTFVNESTITFSWSPPEPDSRNGIIIYYTLCIREYGPESTCTRDVHIPASKESNSYTFSGLDPSQEYIVGIKAATTVGLGPSAFIQKTSGKNKPVCRYLSVLLPQSNCSYSLHT